MAAAIRPVQFGAKPVLPELSPEQQGALIRAKQYAMQESVKHVLKKQQLQAMPSTASGSGEMSQAMLLQRQQALVLMCRVYVGSIFYDLREEVVRQAFAAFGVIKTINMSFDPITGKHKGFAFIEYETPDAAQLAMEQMGGVLLGGRPIKVGRPSNMPQSHPIIDQLLEESKTTKRIYVSSVHEDLSVEDLKSVFSAFGNITACTLAPDITTGKHKGYGSIEYGTVQSAKDAISSMNLFDLGGQNLRVGRGIGPAPKHTPGNAISGTILGMEGSIGMVPPMMSAPTPPMNMPTAVNLQSLPGNIPYAPVIPPPQVIVPNVFVPPSAATTNQGVSNSSAAAGPQKVVSSVAQSKIMRLGNMVGPEDIDKDLEAEVTEECGKFGPVNKVVMYQEKQEEGNKTSCVVKIFVEFENPASTSKAVDDLNSRWFGGRQIEASFYPEEKYHAGEFS